MDDGSRRRTEHAVQRTITDSALAGERVVSIVRIVFCLAVGIRSAWMWGTTSIAAGHEAERAWLTFPALALALGFSVAMLAGLGRRHTRLMLHLSVAIDAIVCFVALVPNALWPGPDYRGTPFMIDTAVLPLLATAAGLRHSATAAGLGGLLHGLSYGALAVIDHVAWGHTPSVTVAAHLMYAILLAAAAALAVTIAIRTRRLVERGARAALNAEQAGAGLRAVLRDHHDLRTVIMSAQINADLLARRGDATGDTVEHLRDDLDELRHYLDQVKSRAIHELAELEDKQPAEIAAASAQVMAALAPRFPDVALDAAADGAPAALVAGGSVTLRRILANLVVNACEGDGVRGARRVAITARRAETGVAIEIEDDGPGLPPHVLATPPGQAVSTKPIGMGLGIGLVAGMVRASGGTVAWKNATTGGACVVVELPAAE